LELVLKLYHGTNDEKPILRGELNAGTWLAHHLFHAYRIAERRVAQKGGTAVVLEIDTDSIARVEGRNIPTYQYGGGKYNIAALHKMTRCEI
jgi:RNA:NAD 2'-phosphotransferase (TPT1/KptA family)